MLQIQFRALIFRADNFHIADKFFGMRIIQKKREALRGFMSEPAAAGFLPRKVFVKNLNGVARARKLFATNRAGRTATDNHVFGHGPTRNGLLPSIPAREKSGRETLPIRTGGREPGKNPPEV
jgi:hypothetical protein